MYMPDKMSQQLPQQDRDQGQPTPSLAQQASQIPNLNISRGQRGGLRGLRGLAARRGGPPIDPDNVESQEDAATRRDKIIQQTDNDASASRMSAVNLGYLVDFLAINFVKPEDLPIPKRYPIINRGTYMRTSSIDRLFDQFLNNGPENRKQIISLGAGSDTRFFRRARKNLVFHEVDFPTNTSAKIASIQQASVLKDLITSTLDDPSSLSINPDKTALYSETLNIHPIDLRQIGANSSPPPTLPNLDLSLPTLILSECCLCYIPPETTTQILAYLTSLLNASVAIILYEPVRPYDAFGRTMSSNLSSRGIELRTVKRYYSLRSQRDRLKQAGFVTGQGARTMNDVYYGVEQEAWISPSERARVERLEWLDEVEEWKLLGGHYCLAWAWKDGQDESVFSDAWQGVRGEWTESERADDEMM